MNQSKDAARWIVLLEAGLAVPSEIIAWADACIIASEKPSMDLIDLATTAPELVDQISSHLTKMRSKIDLFDALRYASASLRESIEIGRATPERIATFTYTYLCGHYSSVPDDLRYLYLADDEFYLAVEEKYGDRESVVSRFMKALKNAERG